MPDEYRSPRNPLDPVRVFYVRAEEDDELARYLDKHLAISRRATKGRPALLNTWNPGTGQIGEGREDEIRRRLDDAEMAVAFITKDLWASERYEDLARALELRDKQKLRLVPILAQSFDLRDHEVAALASLPRRGGPLDKQPNRDEAYKAIAEEIVAMAQDIQAKGLVAVSAAPRGMKDTFTQLRRRETSYAGPAPQIEYSGSLRPVVKGDASVREGLERVVRKTNQFQDVARWNARLGRIQRQVCRIQAPGSWGTGFLIGPDLVLTNYHVIEGLLATPSRVGLVSVLFDDAAAVAGTVAVEPRRCALREDWLVDHRPYSQQEKAGSVDPEEVLPEELDYAVLRLAQTPGNDVVARTAAGDPVLRGWLQGQPSGFEAGSPLFIVQHPAGAPMKLALDTDAVVRLSSNGLRVTYRTNTEPGSSGAPCFNQQWDLVALHHHGAGEQNQGIPILKIVKEITKKVELQAPPP